MPRYLALRTPGYTVLVDDEEYARLSKDSWLYYRHPRTGQMSINCVVHINGKRIKMRLSRAVLRLPSSYPVQIIHRNGDALDFRRENLVIKCGVVYFQQLSKRAPWAVRFDVNGHSYHLGNWPTRAWAERIRESASREAIRLRMKPYAPAYIQRCLDRVAGRIVD